MLLVPDSGLIELSTRNASCGFIKAWLSPSDEDAAWDDFLARTTMGQFQQSSAWAQVKNIDNWRHLRVLITRQSLIVGGFQILFKKLPYLGNIGYVSKGPVIPDEDPSIVEFALSVMLDLVQRHEILALMVQPPDNSSTLSSFLARYRFSHDYISEVVTANLIVDISMGVEAVVDRMRKHVRQEIRQGMKRGIIIREGNESEISVFFGLMLSSCKKQGVKPNPASEAALRQMWRAFASSGHIRLTLAEYRDEVVAGLLSVPFGERVTLWKKGWSNLHSDRRPNHLLYYETFQWAKAHGYRICDFAGLREQLAVSLLQGRPFSTEEKKTRDYFNLGFGGSPVLLPPTSLYVANRIIRWTYCKILPRVSNFPIIRDLPRRITSV